MLQGAGGMWTFWSCKSRKAQANTQFIKTNIFHPCSCCILRNFGRQHGGSRQREPHVRTNEPPSS
eukprot:3129722-Pyramimonas_sp.AAC.1